MTPAHVRQTGRVDLGEHELIARLAALLPEEGAQAIGEDAATSDPAGAIAVSVDAIVDGVHFRRSSWQPEAIGHKALATALSDLAAVGAGAGEAYVALGVPSDLGLEEAERLYAGLAGLARRTMTAVRGGDVTSASQLWACVTVIGHLPASDRAITRGGARPGDLVLVTGELGGARAALSLDVDPDLVDGRTAAALRERQQRPTPRLAAGRALSDAGASAMIDLSDGLAADAARVARASGVRIVVELGRLPVQPGVAVVAEASGKEALELAAAGGEDYELLAAVPPDHIDQALAASKGAGVPATVVGEVTEGAGTDLIWPDGRTRAFAGFDQLRDAPCAPPRAPPDAR